MARRGGGEPGKGDRQQEAERLLEVRKGVNYYLGERQTAKDLGVAWSRDQFFSSDPSFLRDYPDESIRAAIKDEIVKREGVETANAAAPAVEAPKAPEPERKKKKERKPKKRLTHDESAALQGEALAAALSGVSSVKEARYFSEVFEKVGRPEDALTALIRAWELHDRRNEKDFRDLTSELVLKIVEIQGAPAAKLFVKDRIRPIDTSLATAAGLAIISSTTSKVDKTAPWWKRGGAQPTTFVPDHQRRYKQRRYKPPQPAVENVEARMGMEPENESAGAAVVENTPATPEEAAEEFEILTENTVKNALRKVGIDPDKSPEENILNRENTLKQVKTELERSIAAADLGAIERLLGSDDENREDSLIYSKLDKILEGDLRFYDIRDFDILISGLNSKDFQPAERLEYWKEYLDKVNTLANTFLVKHNKTSDGLMEKARQRKAELLERKKKTARISRPGSAKKGDKDDKSAAGAEPVLQARETGEEQVAPSRTSDFPPTAEERKKIEERNLPKIKEHVAARFRKVVERLTKEGKGKLQNPGQFKYSEAIQRGEWYILDQMASRPGKQWLFLKYDGPAAIEAIKFFLGDFAKEAGLDNDQAQARLSEISGLVSQERKAVGGDYLYKNIDPKDRFKSEEGAALARLKLADIGEKVQLPRADEAETRFADLLDFLEAARILERELKSQIHDNAKRRQEELRDSVSEAIENFSRKFIAELESSAAERSAGNPADFKLTGAISSGERAVFALIGAQGQRKKDIVNVGVPGWQAVARNFLPEFAKEIGLSEAEFNKRLEALLGDISDQRKGNGDEFVYRYIDPTDLQRDQNTVFSRLPIKDLRKALRLRGREEENVVAALDYFEAIRALQEQLKKERQASRAEGRRLQEERTREMRENREGRVQDFAAEVEIDALLWASDKQWWGEDEEGWERARQAVVLYQREHFGKTEWSDERKVALREIMRLVWARRDFVIAKKAAGAVGLDSQAARELLKFAGIKTRAIIPLVPPRRKPGAIHVNISGEEGVVSGASYHEKVKAARETGKIYDPSEAKNNVAGYVKPGERTLSFDHHNAGISLPDAASAQYLFETLEFLGFFTDKNEHFNKEFTEKFGYTADNLRKALELVMYDDTKSHPAWKDRNSKYWDGPWYRSLLAIAARANFKSIVKYVKDHPDTDFTEEISEDDVKKYGFVQKDGRSLVEKNEETNKLAKKHWAELLERGYSVYTEEVGGELRELSKYYLIETETPRLGKVKIVFVEAGQENKGGYRGGGFPGSIDHLRGVAGRDVLYLIYNPPYERQGDGRTYSMGERIFATLTDQDLPEDLFPGGERLRRRMWNYTGDGLEKQASIRAIFKALGVSAEELQKNKALEKAMRLEKYDPEKPLTPEEVGWDSEKVKAVREILREELVEKYADEFAKEYPNMAKRGRQRVVENAEDYVKDKGEAELEKKFQRTLHARMQREIAKQRS
ncbi:hypothetical protein HY477_01665 [Candidatus Uhrbacteria bacterium]|nr:hypothetical protein [Candidatus Uhrbacteria bacterium]